MKIIFKFIKFLVILTISLTVMGIALAFVLYKDDKKPEIDNNLSIKSNIISSLDNLIDPENSNKEFNLSFSEELLNLELQKILNNNLNKGNTNDYIIGDDYYKFNGAWVKYENELINIYASFDFDAYLFTYKTSIKLGFAIKYENDEIILNLKELKVGKAPLTWISKLTLNAIKKFSKKDINKMLEEIIGGVGSVDLEKQEIKISIDKLIEKLDIKNDTVNYLIRITKENNLINLGFVKKDEKIEFGITVDFNKIKDNKKAFELEESKKIKSEIDNKAFLNGKAVASILNNEDTISFNKEDINKIIEYQLSAKINAGIISKNKIYEDYEIIISNLYFDTKDNISYINIPIKIGKDEKYFLTTIIIQVTFEKSNNNLDIKFSDTTIGEIKFGADKMEEIIKTFLPADLGIVDNKIVIDDFFAKFDEVSISFTDILVADDNINFNYTK